ncbi:7-carboxy-7-deazaguanine synthase QueE [Aerosakkonemataceae cyanobacterium BLCC-F154]|uniref:7-carboxy-7-deazaguanine synthase n=1 Tax=Floridaenema fluviatile BLCC-F154 TaxID=3153640 RepID=A0ABV4YJ98_9CYAN
MSILEIKLPIHETFQSTVQGEGYWSGTLVDFIRLSGCPVGCPWCDTGYADGGKNLPRVERPIDELLGELKSPRVVISGGEPFIQKHLPELVQALLDAGKKVHIETSGSFWQEVSPEAWITLSPKQHINPKYPVQPQFWSRSNEVKIVIETGREIELYKEHLSAHPDLYVYLQPEWNRWSKSLSLILQMLQEKPDYKLSLQTHKYIGVQ